MMRGILTMLILAACSIGDAAAGGRAHDEPPGRWPAEKAWAWHKTQPWLVGCNFLPSTAVNDVEMWQKQTFDPETIDRELAWAHDLGFNSVRVFLNYVVWHDDPDGLKSRLKRFLDVAERRRICVMPVLFDDCAFAGREPAVGKQAAPVPGVHNSGWVPSPGPKRVTDRAAWPHLKRYVTDLVGTFGRDPRVVVWDLYNEPGNSGMGEKSLPLMLAAFAWAREARPTQPLTVAAWANFHSPMQRRMMELSDIVSFHDYDPPQGIRAKLAIATQCARPVVCTEWLRRQTGNTFQALLALFRKEKIGCYNWGLVAGRTQTYMPWDSPKGAPMPEVWQHDIFHKDGQPFSPAEVRVIKAVTGGLAPAEASDQDIDKATLDRWSAPYRGWHYWPDHVIGARPRIPGHEAFVNTDCPTVFQLPGSDAWHMSFIAFNGKGYNSFIAESDDLVHWKNMRLAMGFGPKGEFDHGGCALGAYLYESYDIKARRLLKKRDGKLWSLYGCYPRQGAYELRPGYEGLASSDDGLAWRRAKDTYILSVHDADCGAWEKSCIYQPWLVEHEGRFYNLYNAARGGIEQTGLATSTDLLTWKRHTANPVLRNRKGGYDEKFCSDPKVFRDGDHWTMLYFGVGRGGAHIMAAFSRDLVHWTAHPEPLYKAGGNPSGLDKQYAHKISLVWNPRNATFYMHYCACGNKGRGIGLITSKPLDAPKR